MSAAPAIAMIGSNMPPAPPVVRPPNVAQVVAVASGKGGVGKSTVAAALAMELVGRKRRVGLLDSDIYGPSIPTLFDAQAAQMETIDEQSIVPARLPSGLQLVSFGFIIGAAPAIMRGPMISRYISQLLLQVVWDDLDILIIDMPPGTGDIHLTITQEISLDAAIIVTTPQALCFSDVGKAILMFERVNVPIVGLVENMAWFVCDQCGTHHAIFGAGSQGVGQRLIRQFGIPIITRLPLDAARYAVPFGSDTPPPPDPHMQALARCLLQALRRNPAAQTRPTVAVDEHAITLRWEDGHGVRAAHRDLRAACNCALCVSEYSGVRRLTIDDIDPQIQAVEVRPLGNYALYIRWSDNHATGFFPYRLVRQIGVAC